MIFPSPCLLGFPGNAEYGTVRMNTVFFVCLIQLSDAHLFALESVVERGDARLALGRSQSALGLLLVEGGDLGAQGLRLQLDGLLLLQLINLLYYGS